MAQIVPRQSGFESLGAGFGSGLSTGLEELAKRKMLALQQRHGQERGAQSLQGLGFSPDEATAIASLPEKVQGQILQAYLQRGGSGQSNQPQDNIPQQQTSQQVPVQETTLQQLLGQIGPQGKPGQIVPGQLTDIMQNAIGKTKVSLPQIQQEQQAPTQSQSNALIKPRPTVAEVLSRPSPHESREQELLKLKQESAKERTQNKRQGSIEKANTPFIASLQKAVPVAEEMSDKAMEMLNLLKNGNVDFGITGKFTPNVIQNVDSQRFLALSNDIASLLAANSGVATNFKIKFAQERKPNLSQNKKTQEGLTKDLIKQAQKVILREKFANELIAGNDYQQPPNLKSQVDSKYQQFKKLIDTLPNADDLQNDTRAVNDATGEVFVVKNGIWLPE